METLIIKQAFIIFCMVIAIWCCMLERMIFGKIREVKMPEWMQGILYDCCVCMMPYYGGVIYVLYDLIPVFVKVIMVGMGMATIFVKIKKN